MKAACGRAIFAQRCGRLQAYVGAYLRSKGVHYLLVSNVQRGRRAAHNEAVLNYLLSHTLAGLQLVMAKAPISNCLLVIAEDRLVWYCDDLAAVDIIAPLAQGLTNHQIVCGHALDTLSSGRYCTNFGRVPHISAEEYQALYNDKECAIAAIRYDRDGSRAPHEVFLTQTLVWRAEEERIVAVAGPPDEAEGVCGVLQSALGARIVSVQQSIQQLLLGHVDAGALYAVQAAAFGLRRQFAEITNNLEQKDELAAQPFALAEPAPDFPKKSFVRHQAVDRATGMGIYDVFLSHPRIPAIYRQPYIVEGRGAGAGGLRLLGFVDNFLGAYGFHFLNKLLHQSEEHVGSQFKEFLRGQLTRGQPDEFVAPLLDLINGLKLNVEFYQLDGSKVFGRHLSNIQIACQLKHEGLTYTLFFGRSYVSYVAGRHLNINQVLGGFQLEKQQFQLFQINDRLNYQFADDETEQDALARSRIGGADAYPCKVKVCMLMHNCHSQQGEVKEVEVPFWGSICIEPFTVTLELKSIKTRQKIYLQNIQTSKKYVQLIALFNKIPEDSKFKPQLYGKRLYLVSFNMQQLVDVFGNYFFGYFSYEFQKVLQNGDGKTVEGFAIQVDTMGNTMAFSKMQQEIQSGEYQTYDELLEYVFLDQVETGGDAEDSEREENVKRFYEIMQNYITMDDRSVFYGRLEDAGYSDKLLSKNALKTPEISLRKEAGCKLVVIQTPNAIRPGQLLVSSVVKYYKQYFYGASFTMLRVQAENELATIKELRPPGGSNTVFVIVCNEVYNLRVLQAFSGRISAFVNLTCNPSSPGVNLIESDGEQRYANCSDFNAQTTQLVLLSSRCQGECAVDWHVARVYSLEEDNENAAPANQQQAYQVSKSVKRQVCQYFIDSQELFDRLSALRMCMEAPQLKQFVNDASGHNSLKQMIIQWPDTIEVARQVNLKLLSETFRRPEMRALFKGLLGVNAIFLFKFDKFVIELCGNAFSIDLEPEFLLTDRKTDTLAAVVSYQDAVLKGTLEKETQKVLSSLFLVIQSLYEEKKAVVEHHTTNSDIDWAVVKEHYKDLPPPDGYFSYYGMYMDWYGNVETERPDKEQLMERYYREVLGRQQSGGTLQQRAEPRAPAQAAAQQPPSKRGGAQKKK